MKKLFIFLVLSILSLSAMAGLGASLGSEEPKEGEACPKVVDTAVRSETGEIQGAAPGVVKPAGDAELPQ